MSDCLRLLAAGIGIATLGMAFGEGIGASLTLLVLGMGGLVGWMLRRKT